MNSLFYGKGLFETIRVSGGEPEFLSRHLQRMEASAQALGISFCRDGFLETVEKALGNCSAGGDYRLRITLFLGPDPLFHGEINPLGRIPATVRLCFSDTRVFSGNPLTRHKTTSRLLYHLVQSRAEEAGFWDGIILNEKGEIAETGRANIVLLVGGEFLTPQASAGLLPGIVRGILLESGAIREARLYPGDLDRAEGVFAINSLVRVAGVAGVEGSEYRPDPRVLVEKTAELTRFIRS